MIENRGENEERRKLTIRASRRNHLGRVALRGFGVYSATCPTSCAWATSENESLSL
jgi:hypothetical protein